MCAQTSLVVVGFVKRASRTLLYSLIAAFFIGSATITLRAQTVDSDFIPCQVGIINFPAVCVRTATCTTVSLWAVRVLTISGTSSSTKASPGTDVYNYAAIKLMVGSIGIYELPALDRNRNGMIDSGKELFGNFTFQTDPPTGVEKNGFLALAEYDKPENGGNNDGMIDANDAVFRNLRLWRDANQNGISEASELRALADSQIESISLEYRESHRTDRYGNTFRYRAKVYGPNHSDLGRWAYDVYLKSEQ